MSCTSVDIVGNKSEMQIAPSGPPLLIANLDHIRRECHTKEQTSVTYPKKYIGITPVKRAPVALDLQEFSTTNLDGCGSDNSSLIALIKGSPDGVVTK